MKNRILFRTSLISSVGNAFLAVAKLVFGFISGSLAVISDGIDSTTDVVISVIMIFTARIVNRPPDRKHVYGHEKAESIATKILSLIIFYAGVQMIVSAVKQIFTGEERILPSLLAIYITLISIAGKLLLSFYQFKQAKKIDSSILKANAINMRNDVVISVSVLVGLIFTFLLKMPILDAITSILVAIYILYSAFRIFMDSNVELMDSVKDTAIYNSVFDAAGEVAGANRPHRVRIRTLGGKYIIGIDIEVDGDISLNEAHKIANEVEAHIRYKIPNTYDIRIHIEPIGTVHSDEKFGLEKQ
ncbi:MAG: cation diffusion facilitator family transporter [Prevotellaceae bacterium]|jgi:cation diffusion facilitator family transporter|nr:cation diffusion facilitator family transporter [Prevotellaceae bacterium]